MLDKNIQRKLKEVLTRYKLEPELRDIYVEGITDKLLFTRFLKKNKVKNFKVVEINHVNFDEVKEQEPHIKRNNRNKLLYLSSQLLYLSSQLKEKFGTSLENVLCIIDKDFDEILQPKPINNYVVFTDFNSLELYLFNEHCINIFYENILRGFPVTPRQTIRTLEQSLVDLFLLRLSCQSIKFSELKKKDFSFDKDQETISFDRDKHLYKLLNANGLTKEEEVFQTAIVTYEKQCIGDVRNYIRGHDFIFLFYLFVNTFKSKTGFTEDTLERSFFTCIDFSELHQYSLFKTLLRKYK